MSYDILVWKEKKNTMFILCIFIVFFFYHIVFFLSLYVYEILTVVINLRQKIV